MGGEGKVGKTGRDKKAGKMSSIKVEEEERNRRKGKEWEEIRRRINHYDDDK